jgi:hypothetical protein
MFWAKSDKVPRSLGDWCWCETRSSKVQTLDNWHPPTRLIDELQDVTTSQQRAVSKKKLVQECRRYVGFMNYFARFIPRYSALASCLQDQTKDIAPEWTPSVPVHGTLAYLSQGSQLMYHPDFTRAFQCLFRCFYPGWGMLVQYDGNDEHVVASVPGNYRVLRSTTLPLNRSYWASFSASCSGDATWKVHRFILAYRP